MQTGDDVPLVLTTATVPDDAYWAALPPGGLDGWSEDGAFNLYPDTNGTQSIGLYTNRVDTIYGTGAVFLPSNIVSVPYYYNYVLTGSIVSSYQNSAVNTYGSKAVAGSIAVGKVINLTYPAFTVSAYMGSLAGGYAKEFTEIIGTYGGTAFGYFKAFDSESSASEGSISMGYSIFNGWFRATKGSVAVGESSDSYAIFSAAKGSLAVGYKKDGGFLSANNEGSVCLGYSSGYGINLLVYSNGSLVAGFTPNAFNVATYGLGSMALGDATVGTIAANSNGSVQINRGSNSIANSLKIGNDTNGIRFIGSGATSTRNGDIWCDGTDVFVRTGGVTKTFSSIP